jgi:signal transduction histidine kinase/CheY-like chemotaxis protein/HPt (histidine-containing phosphotransfer) domain-containing protein
MRKALATVFNRLGAVRRLLLLSALGFLAVAVVANSVVIVQRQEALARVSRYNLTWLLSQAAHEVLRLEEVISAATLPGTHIDADAVALRLDVLANRMVLLRTGEAAEFLHERPELQRSVDELEASLPVIEKLIAELPDPQVALHLRALLEPLVPRMLQMAAAANVRSGDIVAQDQHDLSLQHWLLTGLLATAGVLIAALLYRFASAQQKSKADLEGQISERTAQLRESLEYQTAISDVLKVMSRSTFDVAPVLQVVLDTATRLCRTDMAALYQRQDGAFRWMAGCASGPLQPEGLPAPPVAPEWEQLVSTVARDRKTVQVADAAADPDHGTSGEVGRTTGPDSVRSMLGIPMIRDGQLVGVLALARHQVEDFSDKQVEVAMLFADQAAIAIENVRLINEIRDKSLQLEKALQHKSQFLATMSHELRTPMNGVLGMIDVLEAEGPGKDQKHTLMMMRESAQVLLRNINDLLDYSRIEAGALRLEELPFLLKDLVDGAVQVFQPQASRKGLSLVGVVAPGSADAFLGDPTRVRQVIFNLLSNALKFTDRGGIMLRAGAEPADGEFARVTFSVRDTGIGIGAEQQSRLFKPFSQLDNSITRRFGGSGLGLSIVKQLAELMGGDVTVHSLPGAGSTFTVTLKLKPAFTDLRQGAVGLQLAVPPVIAPLPANTRGRVLVVDDNPINCEVLLRQLKVLGIVAEPAADGFAGFSAWRGGDYDMVFADIHMPLMDGFTMTAEIRAIEASERRGRTPIIAVTADALAGEEERCRAAGMDDYLAKPVGLDSLRKVLQRWLPDKEADAPAIDPTVLDPWVENDGIARQNILRRFGETVTASSQDIERALANGDLATLQSVAHRLRSGALAVGARILGESAAALEKAARKGDRPACEGQLGALVAEMGRVQAHIGAQVH